MTREEAIAILEVSKHMATSGRMYNQAIDMAIEALQEQVTGKLKKPCNSLLTDSSEADKESDCKLDLISRADAMAEFREWVKRANEKGFEDAKRAFELEYARLADRPTAEWIPCSERLPSDSGNYLITVGSDIADEITTYITELFNSIRESEVKE